MLHRAFHIWVNLSMAKELCEIDSELSHRKLPSDKGKTFTLFFLSLDNLLCGMQLLWPGLENSQSHAQLQNAMASEQLLLGLCVVHKICVV